MKRIKFQSPPSLSTDGQTVVSASFDGAVRLWNVSTGEQMQRRFGGHHGELALVAFSPDGQTVASASWDQTIQLWNVSTGERLHTIQMDLVFELAFSKSGQALETNHGPVDVSAYVSPQAVRETVGSASAIKMGIREQWVTYGDEDVLWLPHGYRKNCSAAQGNFMVVGHLSGALTFFTAD